MVYGDNRDDSRQHLSNTARQAHRITLPGSTGKRVLEKSRARLFLIAVVFACCFIAVGLRTLDVAVLRGLFSDAEETVGKTSANALLPRAEITDRNGIVIATSLKTLSLFANPQLVKNPKKLARKLIKILPDENEAKLAKQLGSGHKFIWVKRQLTPKQQKQVNDLGEPALDFLPEYKRIYPYGPLFAHVLGYVDVDGKGMAGLERGLNDQLTSKGETAESVPVSLDMRIQAIVREEVKNAIDEFKALGGLGIVMDVKTGEVLAMSSLPDYDPHEPGRASDDAKFNRATLGVYEMGSTFKTFTMAVALETGIATMQSSFDATRPIYIGKFRISDAHPENRWMTVPEIFAYSSNIGTVRVIQQVGAERQQAYLRSLGLFKPVDMEVKEAAKPLLPNPWRQVNMMTVAYGHGLAVTPMHLVRAFASLVGYGRLLPVTFVKDGNKDKPQGEILLSRKNVKNIRHLLRLVVEHGTGSKGEAPGYYVGGKTGTAEKLAENGRYKDNAKIVSFIGAFPANDPRYVVLVTVDEPKGNKKTYGFATGGWISAPPAGKIIARMAPMLGMRPVKYTPLNQLKNDQGWAKGIEDTGEGENEIPFRADGQ